MKYLILISTLIMFFSCAKKPSAEHIQKTAFKDAVYQSYTAKSFDTIESKFDHQTSYGQDTYSAEYKLKGHFTVKEDCYLVTEEAVEKEKSVNTYPLVSCHNAKGIDDHLKNEIADIQKKKTDTSKCSSMIYEMGCGEPMTDEKRKSLIAEATEANNKKIAKWSLKKSGETIEGKVFKIKYACYTDCGVDKDWRIE